jgi:hypothetical protein
MDFGIFYVAFGGCEMDKGVTVGLVFVLILLVWAVYDTWFIARKKSIGEKESNYADAIAREQEKNRRKSDDFKLRKARDTENMRREFTEAVVVGRRVVAVGDMVWWPNVEATELLAACKLDDGSIVVVGRENGGLFVLPDASTESHLLAALTDLPRLELDDDGIFVWLTDESYLIVSHQYDTASKTHRWQFFGVGCVGSIARKKFAAHGIHFDASCG